MLDSPVVIHKIFKTSDGEDRIPGSVIFFSNHSVEGQFRKIVIYFRNIHSRPGQLQLKIFDYRLKKGPVIPHIPEMIQICSVLFDNFPDGNTCAVPPWHIVACLGPGKYPWYCTEILKLNILI